MKVEKANIRKPGRLDKMPVVGRVIGDSRLRRALCIFAAYAFGLCVGQPLYRVLLESSGGVTPEIQQMQLVQQSKRLAQMRRDRIRFKNARKALEAAGGANANPAVAAVVVQKALDETPPETTATAVAEINPPPTDTTTKPTAQRATAKPTPDLVKAAPAAFAGMAEALKSAGKMAVEAPTPTPRRPRPAAKSGKKAQTLDEIVDEAKRRGDDARIRVK